MNPADHQRRNVLYDIHQNLLLAQQMDGASDARIVEWLLFGVEPSRVNYALIEFRGGQAGCHSAALRAVAGSSARA